MALFKCPECSQEVSATAASCSKCGHVFNRADTELEGLVKQSLLSEGKIAAIKLYRTKNRPAGLYEAKQYVERIEASLPPGSIPKSRQGCMQMLALGGLLVAGCTLLLIWSIHQR